MSSVEDPHTLPLGRNPKDTQTGRVVGLGEDVTYLSEKGVRLLRESESTVF